MTVIGVISMKGGVGKTSVTANLAAAMAARLGPNRVLAVDLDPQDALHLHLGVDDSEHPGLCVASLKGRHSWSKVGLRTESEVLCLPFGQAGERERESFEDLLASEPNWVGQRLGALKLHRDAVVLIDTPPGPSVYLKQVFECADIVVCVLLPDAGSYATVPAMESWLRSVADVNPHMDSVYLLNQVNRGDMLNRDVSNLLHQQLGDRLAPIGVHDDEAVREALAFQKPVMVYEPHGQASHDLARLADWLIGRLSE